MSPQLFVDTAVLAYAVGGPHPERDGCRAIVAAATAGKVEIHLSVEALQELLHHLLRREARERAVAVVRDVQGLCHTHAMDANVVEVMLDLVTQTHLRGRDAVHAATALIAGFDTIVSPDRDFDGVAGLARLDPQDALPE